MKRVIVGLSVLVTGVLVSGLSADTVSQSATTQQTPAAELPRIKLEPMFRLQHPTYAVHDPAGRMFFLEQPGRVRLMEEGKLLEKPYLDLTGKLLVDYECGLLSIAFHPKFASNGYVYANFTINSPNLKTVIAEYHVDPAAKEIDPSTERVVMTINQPYINHKGGQLQFGPDGYLYIGMGDGGNQKDPHKNGQNPQVLLGKMLRIDVTPRQGYGIPKDNPFSTRGKGHWAPEIFAIGLRNPWRFSFDPETGLLYVNANEMGWLLRMMPRDDHSLYKSQCASCHGDDMTGGTVAPSLLGVAQRHTREELATIIRQGTGRMPGFAEMLEGGAINDLVNFLVTGKDIAETATTNPNFLKYRNTGYPIFLDHEGYPGVAPPWGTLNAIDLNAGEIRWTIPFGEYPALAEKGIKNTGTDNYGGPVVTKNGLLFIGATTYDRKFHVFDKRTGELLWEAELPASGNATPSLYMVNGKEYVAIAAGGGKNGAPSGGTFVAFSLP